MRALLTFLSGFVGAIGVCDIGLVAGLTMIYFGLDIVSHALALGGTGCLLLLLSLLFASRS